MCVKVRFLYRLLLFPYESIEFLRSHLCKYRMSLPGGFGPHPGAYLVRRLLLAGDSFLLTLSSLYAALVILIDWIRVSRIRRSRNFRCT